MRTSTEESRQDQISVETAAKRTAAASSSHNSKTTTVYSSNQSVVTKALIDRQWQWQSIDNGKRQQ